MTRAYFPLSASVISERIWHVFEKGSPFVYRVGAGHGGVIELGDYLKAVPSGILANGLLLRAQSVLVLSDIRGARGPVVCDGVDGVTVHLEFCSMALQTAVGLVGFVGWSLPLSKTVS